MLAAPLPPPQPPATPVECGSQGLFTDLTFDNTELILSNLGGQGGRCEDITFNDGQTSTWQTLCAEPEPGVTHANPTSSVSGITWPNPYPNIPDNLGGTHGHTIVGPTAGGAPYGNQHILLRNVGNVSTLNAQGEVTGNNLIWCAPHAHAHAA